MERPKMSLVSRFERAGQTREPHFENGSPFRFEDVAFTIDGNQLQTPDEQDLEHPEYSEPVVSLEEVRKDKAHEQIGDIIGQLLDEITLTKQAKGEVTIDNKKLSLIAAYHTQFEDRTQTKPVGAVYKFWLNNDPTFEYYASFDFDPKHKKSSVLIGGPTLTGEHDDFRVSFYPKFLRFIQAKAQEYNRSFKNTVDLAELPEAFKQKLLESGRYRETTEKGHPVLIAVYKPLSKLE